jgi:hypothetical protein
MEISLGGLQALYSTYKETTNPIPIFERTENSLLRPSANNESTNRPILEASPQTNKVNETIYKDFFDQNYSRGRKSTKNIKNQIVIYEELNSIQAPSHTGRHTKNQESISKKNIFNNEEYTPERSRGASPNISHNSPLLLNNRRQENDSFLNGREKKRAEFSYKTRLFCLNIKKNTNFNYFF